MCAPGSRARRLRRVVDAAAFAIAALLLGAAPAEALVITPQFDSSITGAANAAQLEGAINAAISTVESLYSNTGTVGIIFSQASGNFLAESETQDYSISYSQYTSLLQSNSTANPANTTLSTAIANLASGNKPGPGGTVLATTADARVALGVTAATGCFDNSGNLLVRCGGSSTYSGPAYDGIIYVNNAISFNYTTTPVAGEYSAIAAVEAQINEILGGGGQGSVLNSIPCAGSKAEYPNIGVLDLYRYSSPGVPTFSSCSGTTAYLSVDGGNTDIIGFNDNSAYDLGDFNTTDNVQSAIPASGIVPSYTTASPEFTMMESIGYGAQLTLTATASATTQVGQSYAQTNVASGGTGPYTYSLSAGALPVGTSLNTSTGTVSGTPTTSGPFSYTIKVTDSSSPAQTATQVSSGTIATAAQTLVLTATPSSATQVGQSYSQANVASGGTVPYTYSVSAGTVPNGTTLNTSTGTVSGTPTTAGAFSYTIEVTDSGNPTAQTATQVSSGTIAPATFTLSAGVSGSGTVTSTPSGISCGSTCSASFANGAQVTLNETPASGWVFSGWSGACSGTGSCVVTMSAAESVTAAFLIAQGGGGLTRTFVSSSGVDTNPCTVTAPCATFAQALTLTQPTGIIAALDPGKYGPLTITYPVTVNGNGWAAITAPAQGNGITISADVGNVILTGLEVDGAGAAYNGIVFNSSASLTVSNCIVKDFISANGTSGNGIMIAPITGSVDFTIVNTVALNNGSAGIHYLPASGSAAATGAIDHVIAANNAIGIAVDLSAASGGSAAVTISNSVANNNTDDGIVTASATGTVTVTADRDEISSNGTGVGVGANTTVLLSRSVIAKNSVYGVSNSGTTGSSNDNRIAGNGSGDIHGTGLTAVAPQ
jgi:Putative Ig domain/Divergent InlB B-repeat domain